jgi:hypothetical protein
MAELAEIPLMPVSSRKGRALAFFAGIWPPHACVRMKSKGWEEIEAFGSLNTDSADPVKSYHKKAMPVIFKTEDEWDLWLSGETWDHVKSLQRPLPDGTLKSSVLVRAPATSRPSEMSASATGCVWGRLDSPEAQASLLAEPRLFWPGHCRKQTFPSSEKESCLLSSHIF